MRRPKYRWMESVVENLRELGIKRWSTRLQNREENYVGIQGSWWDVVLLNIKNIKISCNFIVSLSIVCKNVGVQTYLV
jgi:hypothetical protein